MNKKKAVFLDRDGVINKNKIDYVKTINELEIFPNIEIPIKKLKKNNFYVIVITNQSAINRNLMTHEQLNEIHSHIQQYLKSFDTSIDNFYFCPHKPDENCNCRKPKSGMLLEAIKEFNIDPKLSWMLGDNDSDIEAGLNVGCQTIKIGKKINLQKAVDKILNY
jgi:histidinol-phosphate phosphatase family protein